MKASSPNDLKSVLKNYNGQLWQIGEAFDVILQKPSHPTYEELVAFRKLRQFEIHPVLKTLCTEMIFSDRESRIGM